MVTWKCDVLPQHIRFSDKNYNKSIMRYMLSLIDDRIFYCGINLNLLSNITYEAITNHSTDARMVCLYGMGRSKNCHPRFPKYLEKKQLLETPDEQSRLLHEVPKVIADEVEPEATPEDILDNVEQGNNGSPRSILNGASEVPFRNIAANGVASTWTCQSTDFAEFQHDVIEEQPKQPSRYIDKSNGETQLANIESNKEGGMMVEVMTSQVIDLSDDEEKEEPSVGQRIPDDRLGSLLWHYLDPQGEIQGPFSLTSLKRWSDAYYFPPDFKVWKTGQNQDEAVLLKNILH
ncbi:hypothetical protein I3760_06G000500 [Carya illinoinensis]|nr:hypothetical protein I3760_06G000500 [Carya illinoinensis]